MRRLMISLVFLFLAIPVSGNVSLGEIDIRSYLNQPLDARILVQGEALAEQSVNFRLASNEDYRRTGLDRGSVPADLELVSETVEGQQVVRVRTQRPVREPYISLLVEGHWSGGRVLREYIVLLDPPVAFTRTASTAPVVSPSAPPPASAAPPPAQVAESVNHRVRQGETLYSIVARQGYRGLSIEQAMVAVQQANPNAFIGGNMNLLRADAVLTLPSQEEMARVGRAQAATVVREQDSAWRQQTASVTPAPATVMDLPAEPASVPPPAQPQPIVVEAEPPAEVAVDINPAPETAAEPAPEAAAEPEPVPLDVNEPAVALDMEAQSPALPEETAQDTTTETADAETDTAPADAVDAVIEPEPATTPAEADRAPVVIEDRLEILGDIDTTDAAATVTPPDTQVLEEALLSQQMAVADLRTELNQLRKEIANRDTQLNLANTQLAQIQAQLAELQGQQARMRDAQPLATDLPIHERLLADPLLMGLSGGLLFLFLLLIWAIRRSAPVPMELPPGEATTPVPTPTPTTETPAPTTLAQAAPLAGAAAGATVITSKTGVMAEDDDAIPPADSGFTPLATPMDSGPVPATPAPTMNPVDNTPDVTNDFEDDPFADVDLYLAYGMNDQAIAVLNRAIDAGHNEPPYLTRLLEAYAATDDTENVQKIADLLREQLGPDDTEWARRLAAVEERLSEATTRPDTGLDMDVSAATQASTAVAAAKQQDTPKQEPAEKDSSFDGMEFDLPEDSPTDPQPSSRPDTTATQNTASSGNELEFNLDDLDFDTPETTPKPGSTPSSSQHDNSMDMPDLDLPTDFELPDLDDPKPQSQPSQSPALDDLGGDADTSEVGMKLSLAEAFAEMGDTEGALGLLNEIKDQGNETQQARAASIRHQLET